MFSPPLSPTPWRCIENPSEVLYTHTIVDADHESLARVSRLSRALGRVRDENFNAAIMAAAPELLESLQSCVATLEAQGITGPKVTQAKQLLSTLCDIKAPK